MDFIINLPKLTIGWAPKDCITTVFPTAKLEDDKSSGIRYVVCTLPIGGAPGNTFLF